MRHISMVAWILGFVSIVIGQMAKADEFVDLSNADLAKIEENRVEFTFTDSLPKSKELRFPRLNSRLKSAYWKGKPDQPLTLIPEVSEWRVKLPKPPAEFPLTIVVELLDPVRINRNDDIIEIKKNSEATELPAHFAITRSKTGDSEKLRFEPQPHKNTVGYWTVPTDWAEWSLNFQESGNFHVDIFQGCGKGQGGSDVDLLITQDSHKIDIVQFEVEETGHFQNFKLRRIGTISIPNAGTYRLELRPVKLSNKAVMDVRKIVLSPVE